MAEREPAIIVSLDQNGDVISVEFVGHEKLTSPTFNVFADSPPEVSLVGTKAAIELVRYRDANGRLMLCIHTPDCYNWCFLESPK
jgi:hypothetical protein